MRILVTGGRSEIGQSIIQRRLRMNDEVYYTITSQDSLPGIPAEIRGKAHALIFDLRKPEQSEEALLEIVRRGGFDGIVLNAAMPTKSYKRLHEYSDQEVAEVVEPHLYGNLYLIRKFLPQMIENSFGRLVFISSQSVMGFHKHGLYSGWKSLWEGLFRALTADYGEFNITANIVRPGLIETKRTLKFWRLNSFRKTMIPLIPQHRLGKADDVAGAVDYFLARDCYSNGAVLEVTGGLPSTRSDKLFVNPFA